MALGLLVLLGLALSLKCETFTVTAMAPMLRVDAMTSTLREVESNLATY